MIKRLAEIKRAVAALLCEIEQAVADLDRAGCSQSRCYVPAGHDVIRPSPPPDDSQPAERLRTARLDATDRASRTDDHGRRIAELGLPTLVLQEGGYNTTVIGEVTATLLEGLAS